MFSLGHVPNRRTPKRRRMTLISAFRCKNNRVVMHADSEENRGTFRKSVQKIVPQKMGSLDVIVAGSGIGELIDSFVDRLKERLDKDNASDVNEVKTLIEKRLPSFFKNEVANYPVPDDDKLHKFIIAAYSNDSKQFEVWASRHTRLIPVTSYELAGVEDAVYEHVAKKLYRPDMEVAQAILAGCHLFAIAESTSSIIRSPISIAVIYEYGMWMESDGSRVNAIQRRLGEYEGELNELFLACADVGISLPDLERKL